MPTADSPPEPPPLPNRKAFQFSLRTMMIGMTGFAFLCGFASVLPAAFSHALIGLFWIGASGWLVTGLFFARGDQRAFCIGSAMVVSSMWTRVGGRFMQGMADIFGMFVVMPLGMKAWFDLGLIVATALANGYLCIRARHFFERKADD